MFEYLMPLLLMRSFPGTLLDQSCRASVRRQIEYGGERGVPWGISESAYAFTDRAGNYQYQGVRRARARARSAASPTTWSSRRTPRRWPASSIRPRRRRTSQRLARDGLDGRFGFYEAIDYRPRDRRPTPTRAPATARARRSCAPSSPTTRACRSSRSPTSSATTSSSTRFHADPRVQATELLLQERVPREAILSEPRPAEGATRRAVDAGVRVAALPIAAHDEPAHAVPVERPLHHRAHARRRRLQHVARPGGHAAARGPDLGRRRALHLPARSVVGRGLVADLSAGRAASPTSTRRRSSSTRSPSAGATATSRRSSRSPCRRRTTWRCGGCRSPTAATGRARSRSPATPRSCSARPEDDLAHPAFGKLFIETEFDAQSAGLLFSRRPRAADEAPTWAFHVLGVDGRLGGAVEWETDRARFLGRGRSPAEPGRARRPRAVGHDRRGARSGGGAARARAAGAGRVRPRDVRHRRRAGSRRRRSRWCASTATAAPPRAPSRWRSRTRTSRCSTSA